MPLSTRLFRESALERLSSPEQLDQLQRIKERRESFREEWGQRGQGRERFEPREEPES